MRSKNPLYLPKVRALSKLPTGIEIGSSELAVPNYFANIRTDNNAVWGVVGKDYHIVQNREAFNFFDAIVGGGEGILYETAGALGNGERIFITAKLPDYIRVGNGDDVTEKYIFLTTSHDGSGKYHSRIYSYQDCMPKHTECLTTQYDQCSSYQTHFGSKTTYRERPQDYGLANTLSNQLEGIFNEWTKVKVNDREVRKLIQLALCPNKETLDLIKKGAGR